MSDNARLLIEEIAQLERALEIAGDAQAELRTSLAEKQKQLDAAVRKLEEWDRLLTAQDRELAAWKSGSKSAAAEAVKQRLARP